MSICLNLTDNLKNDLFPSQHSDTTKALSDIVLSLFISLIQSKDITEVISSIKNDGGKSISFINLKSLISSLVAKEIYIGEISSYLSSLIKENIAEEVKSEKFTVTKRIIKNAYDLPLDNLKKVSSYCEAEKLNLEVKKEKVLLEKEVFINKDIFLNKKHSRNISQLDTDFNSLPDNSNDQITKPVNIMKLIDFNGKEYVESNQNPLKLNMNLNLNKQNKGINISSSLNNLPNLKGQNLFGSKNSNSHQNNKMFESLINKEQSGIEYKNENKIKKQNIFLFDPITIEKYNLSLIKNSQKT